MLFRFKVGFIFVTQAVFVNLILTEVMRRQIEMYLCLCEVVTHYYAKLTFQSLESNFMISQSSLGTTIERHMFSDFHNPFQAVKFY